ncbi:hypothetical protein HDU98_010565 [Podochytrium sp. JEL0797]|nr:hypothetical protein HDU98_010565 [Podochytrium sp. JEL0797]
MKQPQAAKYALFDLDGLLLNTEHIIAATHVEMVSRFGHTFDATCRNLILGKKERQGVEMIVSHYNLPISADEYFLERRRLLAANFQHSIPLPGVERLLRHLSHHLIPIAIATSSRRDMFNLKAGVHASLFALFGSNVVCCDDACVEGLGKPHPRPYLEAARSVGGLDVDRGQCLVFEDSLTGARAGIAAGMQVILIPDKSTVLDDDVVKDCVKVLASMEEFDPAEFGLPPFTLLSVSARDRTGEIKGSYGYTPLDDSHIAITNGPTAASERKAGISRDPVLDFPAENMITFDRQRIAIHDYVTRIEKGTGQIMYFNNVRKTEVVPNKISELKAQQDAVAAEIDCLILYARDGLKMLHRSKRGDLTRRKEAYDMCLQKLQTAIRTYASVQEQSKVGMRSEFARQYKIVKPDATESEIEAAIQSGQTQVFASALVSSKQEVLARVQDRQQDLLKVLSSLTTLSELMAELNDLVQSQQPMIDMAEMHVDSGLVDIESGNKQIGYATSYAARARSTKWIIFWIVLVIVLIIAAVIAYEVLKNQNHNQSTA